MNRSALLWMLAGALPVALAAAVVSLWPKDEPVGLYLRIVDDNVDLPADYQWEKVGAFSSMLARKCGINRFETDSMGVDHMGSSFVPLDDASTSELDCLIGEARIHGMTIAVSRGTTPETVECLPGHPARFQPPENIDQNAAATCERGRRENATMTADERK
ncbi:hypothetical protein CVO77_18300 [Sphingopyxis lindanitolerans]|uniref:DUF3617 domain-containing protein n=1 Tax=Sphingopyxis lindanitolerans TaxID=2054227 RepID=A0A2S8B3M7_9SPHN|nr:hypothetical protein [Sphingopyxis lindanitolerans]PQM26926.1 hypothetical protein CVO77_18300 [Sphingopyxis lindanitolerans]